MPSVTTSPAVERLPIWNSLEDLHLCQIVDDEPDRKQWSEFCSMIGEPEFVKAYACRRTCIEGVPDNEKHYALVACFDGHIEYKFAVGLVSSKAWKEMEAYLRT